MASHLVLLFFFSPCGWGYDCIMEVMKYETLQECRYAQTHEFEGWRTNCAVVTKTTLETLKAIEK